MEEIKNNQENIDNTNNNEKKVNDNKENVINDINSTKNSSEKESIKDHNILQFEIEQNQKDNQNSYVDEDSIFELSDEIAMITEDIKLSYFDDLINDAKMTNMQIKALIFASLIYFIDGLHGSLTGLIFLPIIKQYDLDTLTSSIISSSLIFFMSLGSLLSGFLSYKIYRKKIILSNLFMIIVSTILASYQKWEILLLTRCFIGFSLGIIIPIIQNNLTEVLPEKYRSFWLISVTIFFGLGAIVSCQIIKYNFNQFDDLFILLSVPILFIIILFAFLYDENPRYLILCKGDKEEAFRYIQIYLFKDHHKLTDNEKNKIIKSIDRGINKEVVNTGACKFMFKRYCKITFILTTIWILYTVMINGGIFSFFISLANVAIFLPDSEFSPDYSEIKMLLFIFQFFYVFFSVSTIIAAFFTDIKCCGRKKMIFFGFLVSTIVCFYCVLSGYYTGILFGIGACLINVAFNGLNSYTLEVYPTRIRDFAVGYIYFISKFFGFFSNIFMVIISTKVKYNITYFINLIISILGIIFTLMLPFDTYRRKLDEILSSKNKIKSQEQRMIQVVER